MLVTTITASRAAAAGVQDDRPIVCRADAIAAMSSMKVLRARVPACSCDQCPGGHGGVWPPPSISVVAPTTIPSVAQGGHGEPDATTTSPGCPAAIAIVGAAGTTPAGIAPAGIAPAGIAPAGAAA
jgi:hypothetical protein